MDGILAIISIMGGDTIPIGAVPVVILTPGIIHTTAAGGIQIIGGIVLIITPIHGIITTITIGVPIPIMTMEVGLDKAPTDQTS
jgi:hypothetical protein